MTKTAAKITDTDKCQRCGGSGFYSEGMICYECHMTGMSPTRAAKKMIGAAQKQKYFDNTMPTSELSVGCDLGGKRVAAIVGAYRSETASFDTLQEGGTATVIAEDGATAIVFLYHDRIRSTAAEWNGIERRFTPKRKAAAIRALLGRDNDEFVADEWAQKAARRG